MNVKDVLRHRRFWLAVGLAVVAGIVVGFALNLKHGYEGKLGAVVSDSQRMAVVAEQHAAATIQKTDLVLYRLVDEFSPEDEDKWVSSKNVANHLRTLEIHQPELESLYIVKPDGNVFYTLLDGGAPAARLFFGNEAYFAAHRDYPDRGLILSAPGRGNADFGNKLVLSRRINHPDGSFAGMAVAVLALSHFDRFYGNLNPGSNASLTLLTDTRAILAHFPAAANWRGKILSGGQLEPLLKTSPGGGTYSGVSEDGVGRVYTVRQVSDLPLYVDVGLAKQDSLAEWRRNALIDSAVVLALAAAILMLSYARFRRPAVAREENKDVLAFQASHLIEASPDPWVILTPEGVVGDANPAVEQITGVARPQLLGSDFYAYFTEPNQAREGCGKAFADGVVRDYPLVVRHASGRVSEVLYTIASFRNEAGEVQGAYAAARDVSESRRSERLLKFEHHMLEVVCGNASLNSTLELLCGGKGRLDDASLVSIENQALEIVCGNATLSAILDLLCRGMEDLLPGTLCAVMLVDDDGLHLHHAVAPSLPSGYWQAVGGVAIDPTASSCGAAAYSGRQVVCADIAHDPLWANVRESALSHGLAASSETPIFSETDDLLGVFAVYYRTPCQPDVFDLQAASRAAHLAGVAICRKRADQALLQLHEALEKCAAAANAGGEGCDPEQLVAIALLRKRADDRLEHLRKSVGPRIAQDIAKMMEC